MYRRSLLLTLGLTPFATYAAPGPLRVVSSFSILADLIQQVGGSAVAVDTLVGPDGDVHVYEPRPKDLRILTSSAVVVRNGLGLEGWMDRLTEAARFKGAVVTASEKIIPRTMNDADGAAVVDPHAWQDPRNAALYVGTIAGGLGSAEPGNAAFFQDKAKQFQVRIAAMDAWIEAELTTIPAIKRRVITTHDAFGYYGARYGLQFLSAEGISTEFEPSSKAIAILVQQIKREKVGAVFIENMTSTRMAKMLARETGAVLGGTVYSDALSPPNGPAASYLDMLRHNTLLFAAAMRAPG